MATLQSEFRFASFANSMAALAPLEAIRTYFMAACFILRFAILANLVPTDYFLSLWFMPVTVNMIAW